MLALDACVVAANAQAGGLEAGKCYSKAAAESYSVKGGKEVDGQVITVMAGRLKTQNL